MKALFLITFLLLAGCGAGNGENVPDSNTPPPNDEPSQNLLTEIQDTIFTPSCSGCHSGGSAPLGLSLESATIAFQNLVNVDAVGDSRFKLVEPSDPDNSFLVLKVQGDPQAGRRMPLGQSALSSSQIQLIRDWIAQGAEPVTAPNLITKVDRVKASYSPIDKKVVTIYFDSPINTRELNNTSVLVYQKMQQAYFLLSEAEYDTYPINALSMQVTINNTNNTIDQFKVVINDPNRYPITNRFGFSIDGNNDNQEGGFYEKVIQF